MAARPLRPIDLIEEIARLHGYDTFPVGAPPLPRVGRLADQPLDQAITRVRNGLVAWGLYEAQTLSLGPAAGPGSLRLLNPLSSEEAWLRESVLRACSTQSRPTGPRQVRDVRLFGGGEGFAAAPGGGRPVETTRVAAVVTGARHPGH